MSFCLDTVSNDIRTVSRSLIPSIHVPGKSHRRSRLDSQTTLCYPDVGDPAGSPTVLVVSFKLHTSWATGWTTAYDLTAVIMHGVQAGCRAPSRRRTPVIRSFHSPWPSLVDKRCQDYLKLHAAVRNGSTRVELPSKGTLDPRIPNGSGRKGGKKESRIAERHRMHLNTDTA